MRTIELMLEEEQNYFMREAFNTLRTNILFSGRDIKTIVVTSCIAHEGKTTVSFEIARSLAESGKKVLLIDADLRKSVMVSRYSKDRGIVGLSQLLSGQIDIDNAIYNTQIDHLDLIFAGPYPPNPTELVGSDAFKELIATKRADYDYLLIDAPPLGLVIDAAVMASVCDGAIVVLNAGRVKYRMAQDVKNQIQRSGCKILGVVLNQVNRKRSNGGYYGMKYDDTYYGYDDPKKPVSRYAAVFNRSANPQPQRQPQQTVQQQQVRRQPATGAQGVQQQRPVQRTSMPNNTDKKLK